MRPPATCGNPFDEDLEVINSRTFAVFEAMYPDQKYMNGFGVSQNRYSQQTLHVEYCCLWCAPCLIQNVPPSSLFTRSEDHAPMGGWGGGQVVCSGGGVGRHVSLVLTSCLNTRNKKEDTKDENTKARSMNNFALALKNKQTTNNNKPSSFNATAALLCHKFVLKKA